MTNQDTHLAVLATDLTIAELARAVDTLGVEGEDEAWKDALDVEITAHEQHGFYVPTRDELMETTGEFLVHLMMERE